MKFTWTKIRFCTYSYDAEYLWHVVPGMLLDDGYDLTQLLEEVLPHTTVTRTENGGITCTYRGQESVLTSSVLQLMHDICINWMSYPA